MASKKGGGSTTNNRDSNPKYLGVKKTHGQFIEPGQIIVKQRGTKFTHSVGTLMGRDHTIFARVSGFVSFNKNKSISVTDIDINKLINTHTSIKP